jgi:hypothetical protein
MSYWYVKDVGLRRSEEKPAGVAVEIPADTYRHCVEHYSLLDIGYEDGVFYARVDINAYRQEALAKLQNLNYITHKGVQYFDDELPYLSEIYYTRSGYRCELTQEQMIKMVTDRNRRYSLQRRNIQDAECTEEIDAYMRD